MRHNVNFATISSVKLHILTPEKEIYNEEADEVIIPTTAGVIGVLPNHAPLVAQIMPGELEIKHNGKNIPMAVYGGYIEINHNTVSILADYAARVEDIELAKVQEAKERAEKLMQERISEEDFAMAEAELQKALMQLRVVRKYKPKL